MMIIDVRKLNSTKQYEGEVNFSLEPREDLVSVPLCKIASKIEASGHFVLYEDDAVGINGKVRYLLQGSCSRCLAPAEKWIELEWSPLFQKGKAEDENYSYENDTVVLDDSVYETVMLGMPFVLLCKDDCAGIKLD